MHRLLALLLIFLGCLPLPASAATITTLNRDGVTRVIVISGVIGIGDAQKFANIALMTDDAVVALASDGGALKEALDIGRAIRLKGFATYVAANTRCASACALIWLAGVPRQMASTSRIGFHAAYYETDGVREISASGNAIVGSYLNALGFPEKTVLSLTTAPPTSLRWFDPTQVRGNGIEVTVKDFDDVAKASDTQSAATAAQTAETSNVKDVSSLGATDPAPVEIEKQARLFAMRYIDYENEEAKRSMALISNAYDERVSHFGKFKTKQEVLAQHARYVARWPNRKQTLKPGTLIVSCKPPQTQCTVDGVIEWELTARDSRSKGASTWHLVLNRQSDRFFIAVVDGKVIEQRDFPSSKPSGLCIGSFCPFDIALR